MNQKTRSEIAVIGAGIGGLTAARGIGRAGYDVTIFERADELRTTGSGITVQANAMAALERFDVADAVAAVGQRLEETTIADHNGSVISRVFLDGVVDRAGVAIHRKNLVEVLADGLVESAEFGRAVESVEQSDEAVIVKLEDGENRMFDAVVGCDGLHSAVRRSLRGDESLRYAGYTTWRGLAKMENEQLASRELWGAGRRFGYSPLGGGDVYWYAVDNAPEGQEPTEPLLEEVRSRLDGWADVVGEVLDAAVPSSIIRTDTHDRPPIHGWGQGRITLLGDAAHPMTPNLGQGGSQAIEDAVVLGEVLASCEHLPDGLRRYERLRRDRANRFVEESRKIGEVAQWKHRWARSLRDFGLRWVPDSVTKRRFRKMLDFDAWCRRVGINSGNTMARQ